MLLYLNKIWIKKWVMTSNAAFQSAMSCFRYTCTSSDVTAYAHNSSQ